MGDWDEEDTADDLVSRLSMADMRAADIDERSEVLAPGCEESIDG